LNLRPSGYEPDELPGCSTPRRVVVGLRPRGRGDLVAGGGDEGRGWSVDLAATYSPTSWDAVPWALRGFTAEFGMGSGGAPALSATRSTDHPLCPHLAGRAGRGRWLGKSWHGRSVPGRGMRLSLAGVEVDRAIRTGQLHASPRVHTRPIDVVVYHGPDGETWFCGRFPA
jgi:hypothetical protein